MTLVAEQLPPTATSSARRLRTLMAATRISFRWFGVRKTLTHEQKAEAAEPFGAREEFLSAGKKLLDTRHPAFKAVSTVRGRTLNYWKGMTLPYPEPGLRLIRQDDIQPFDVHLTTLRAELTEAVVQLEDAYEEIRGAARQRLGRLYNDHDYPDSLTGLFALEWEFPSVEPPQYLRELSPELFRQEQARVTARFEEAVRLAEEAFVAELGKLVSHLVERIQGDADGKPKVFRDSAVTNLSEFFERFRTLSVGSDSELDELVHRCQRIVRGVEPQALRDSRSLREQIAEGLGSVQMTLDTLLVDRPRRAILRGPR